MLQAVVFALEEGNGDQGQAQGANNPDAVREEWGRAAGVGGQKHLLCKIPNKQLIFIIKDKVQLFCSARHETT